MEQEFGHKTYYLTATHEQKVVGILPLVELKSFTFGHIVCSLPFLNYGGICALTQGISEDLLQYAIDVTKSASADYLELRSTSLIDKNLPTTTHKVSMTLTLDNDPDKLWNKFGSKHRTNIRRVYKNDITVKSGGIELLDTFYYLLSRSWRSLGTPIYRKSFFKCILERFSGLTRIYIAYQNNIPIACAFNGYFNKTVEGLWAGGLPEYRQLQANYVLYWEMIKDACNEGFGLFHLGRSTAESGAEAFKKKWNASQTQLYWQYYLNKQQGLPELNVDNPKYKLAINAWKKLPASVTNLIGPFISKYIP